MIRISKLSDYGLVLMAHLAGLPIETAYQARELAEQTKIAPPTVSKLLKLLAKQGFLISERGRHGGYRLAKLPTEITIADLIISFEGPIAITECNLDHEHCKTEKSCSIRAPWQQINQVITQALRSVKLSDLLNFPKGPAATSSNKFYPVIQTIFKTPIKSQLI